MDMTMKQLTSHSDYNEIVGAARYYLAAGLQDPNANTMGVRQIVRIIKDSYDGGLKSFLVDHGFFSASAIVR